VKAMFGLSPRQQQVIGLGAFALVALVEQSAAATQSGGDPAMGFLIIAVTIAGYFFPSIIAWRRGHHQTLAIFLLNLLLGWTLLGWIGALIWAATAINPERNSNG